MVQLKALIFDVDGTLAETEEAHRLAFNHTFREAGHDWEWSRELYGKLLAVAGGKERILHYINDYLLQENADLDLPANLKEYVAHLHADKTQRYQSMLKNGQVPLRPGVARLIREAHAKGIRLAMATTTSMINVETLFEQAFEPGELDWFDVIVSGEMVTEKKPSPQVYQQALDGLRLPAENCIAFEDSVIGLAAATGAGIETIVVTDTYSRNRVFENPLIVLDQLGEPDQPFEVLKGDAFGHSYVDIELVTKLHTRVHE